MPQVILNAAAIGGTINTQFSGLVTVGSNGTITVDSRDVPSLLAAGALYLRRVARNHATPVAPRVASAGRVVASVALANGTLSIANQPDVPRQVGVRVDPGTSPITAGNIALNYLANDGNTHTDNISAVTAASTLFTVNSSLGVVHLNSAIITGLVGGASPLVQVNDTNSLSVFVDPGFTDFNVGLELTDNVSGTLGTVASSAASITPTTTPNATHTYSWFYKYSDADQGV